MKYLVSLFKNLLPVDWVILIYNITILIFLSLAGSKMTESGYFILIHWLIIGWVFSLSWSNGVRKTKLNQWLRTWYPIFVLIWFIPEIALFQKFYILRNFDPEILLVETTLFPQRYYFTMPLELSLIALELFHSIITSFFILLILPVLLAKKKAGSIIKEYVFVLAFSIIIHLLISLLLPVKGPSDLRLELFPEGTFFIPLVNFITKSYFQSGGTVSSLFVTIGVIIVAYVSKLFPKVHRLMILWLFLLLISTVICTFHYSVSAMAGMLTGLLFLAGGKKLYEKLL
tara:strand:+ start:368 stop:1225 length:858 start_codon:yes stop_codon:yes gene_type:complete